MDVDVKKLWKPNLLVAKTPKEKETWCYKLQPRRGSEKGWTHYAYIVGSLSLHLQKAYFKS